MDATVLKIVMEYGVFAVLFFFMLIYVLNQHKEDKKQLVSQHSEAMSKAQEREDKLLTHIQKSDETQMVIAENVKEVSKNMTAMQLSIGNMQTAMTYMQKDIDELKVK